MPELPEVETIRRELAPLVEGCTSADGVGALAVVGGLRALRAEAVLLTLLVFLGFNVAWLLLLDERVEPSYPGSSAQTK